MTELEEGTMITINIPFTYTIGDIGYHTGRELKTVEDCKAEVLAEIKNDVLRENEVFLEIGEIQ